MLRDDQYRDAFQAAVKATRAKIRHDRVQAPRVIRRVFTVLASKFVHPGLTAGKAWSESGIRDRSLVTVFRDFTGVSLARYLAARRIEVAEVLMMTTDLDLGSISERVGYTYHPTFSQNYERLKGKRPCDAERPRWPQPVIDDETALKAVRGLLDEDAMVRFMEELRQLDPGAAKRVDADIVKPEPQIIVNGKRSDSLEAEEVWREIRDLPFEEQCWRLRPYRFHSTVLFDLLREKSRQEGRKSRQRGVEIAKLALVSLESSDSDFEERIHDLRAGGWACLGNAYRLALDFSASASAFEQADREWSAPRAQPDPLVLANISALRGCLWMARREYVAAARELDRSCALYRQSGRVRDEARELITRARIHTFADKLGEAVEDLREASSLITEDEEKELGFAIRANLANALAQAGRTYSAARELDRARELNFAFDDPLGRVNLDWIDGFIGELQGELEKAKNLYQAAQIGFRDAGETNLYCLVSIDLMAVHSQRSEWGKVHELAARILPILSSLSLYEETLAAVGLLARAVEAPGHSYRILNDLRIALRHDPLAV